MLLGRATGQTLIGGTASGDDLTLQSTSNATRGDVLVVDNLRVNRAESGGDVILNLQNLSNTAGSDMQLLVGTGGASGGDPYILFQGFGQASIGMDNSDSDIVKFTHTLGLNSEVAIQYNSTLDVEMPGGNVAVTNGQIYSAQEDLSGTGGTGCPGACVDTIDWDLGNAQVIDLADYSGDVTLTLSNPVAGASYVVKVVQQATARNVIWPASVLWQSGAAPTISTADDAIDAISCYYDGVNYLCNFGQDYQ